MSRAGVLNTFAPFSQRTHGGSVTAPELQIRRTWQLEEVVPGNHRPVWWPLWMEPSPAFSECSGEEHYATVYRTEQVFEHQHNI